MSSEKGTLCATLILDISYAKRLITFCKVLLPNPLPPNLVIRNFTRFQFRPSRFRTVRLKAN